MSKLFIYPVSAYRKITAPYFCASAVLPHPKPLPRILVWCDDKGMPKAPPASRFSLAPEYCREEDGRWLADIPALPGVTAYGRTKKQATAAAQALALRLIAPGLAAPQSGIAATKAPSPEGETT